MKREIISTKHKALSLNLDPSKYGTIAEIGGGQEVARAFFQAGGASGTIAKTISAYDKIFSDHLYSRGDQGRYVCLTRLEQMLCTEYDELLAVLGVNRQDGVRYFAFANTVETLNFKKDNQGHGWLGVRFELNHTGKPNDIVIHVRLLENDPILQQYTLGTLGVNLIYACFNYSDKPNVFLQSLMDNLSNDRVEITMAKMVGPDLSWVDNRLLCVQLVKNEMTPAIIFDRYGKVQEPDDMLYKKNALLLRGRFRPITYVGFDILKSAYAHFKKNEAFTTESTLQISEITLNNLLDEGEINERDFLDRVDILNGMGQNVMISNFKEFYKLVEYFGRFKHRNLRIIMGVPTFAKVMDKSYYTDLAGGLLEAVGKMFPARTKFYIYPALNRQTKKLMETDDIPLAPDVMHIYLYMLENSLIVNLKDVRAEWLNIDSNEVLQLIHKGDLRWETMVPQYVTKSIKSKKLFGYRGE
ncbi:MAG: hypothetical protein AB7S48_00410 [Bacteroidales bacterium]